MSNPRPADDTEVVARERDRDSDPPPTRRRRSPTPTEPMEQKYREAMAHKHGASGSAKQGHGDAGGSGHTRERRPDPADVPPQVRRIAAAARRQAPGPAAAVPPRYRSPRRARRSREVQPLQGHALDGAEAHGGPVHRDLRRTWIDLDVGQPGVAHELRQPHGSRPLHGNPPPFRWERCLGLIRRAVGEQHRQLVAGPPRGRRTAGRARAARTSRWWRSGRR